MANGVYWIGQNGKTYMKVEGGNGVQEWFAPLKSPEQMGLTRIDDPVNPTGYGKEVTSTAPSGGGTAKPVLNQAAVDATNQAIASLDVERDTGYRNIDDSFNSLISRYDKEAARTGEDYTEQSNNNTNDLTKNKQNALLAAAQGRRGLRGTLASLGALSGDGAVLADRVVTQGANQDIGEAGDTLLLS